MMSVTGRAPLPLTLLAPRLCQLAAAIRFKCQTGDAIPLTAVLAVVATVVNLRKARVTHDGLRKQSLNQLFLLLAESGLSKSPAIGLLLPGVKARDARNWLLNKSAGTTFTEGLRAWRTELNQRKQSLGRRKAKSSQKTSEFQAMAAAHAQVTAQDGAEVAGDSADELCNLQNNPPQLRVYPRLIVDNPTFSGLIDRLVHGWPELFLSDEAFGVKRSGLLWSGKLAPLYAGDTITDESRSHGLIVAPTPRLVFCTAVQPFIFQKWLVAQDGDFRSSGALARMILLRAVPNYGTRNFTQDTRAADVVIEAFQAWIESQLNEHEADDYETEALHVFNDEALEVLKEWWEALERQQLPGNQLRPICDAASKAPDQVIRLAASIEWYETGSLSVSANSVRAAIVVIEYSLWCHLRFVGPEPSADVSEFWTPRLLDWLKTQLPVAWASRPLSVLKANCPPEACPRALWTAALDDLVDRGMLICGKKSAALTGNAFGQFTIDLPNTLMTLGGHHSSFWRGGRGGQS